MGRLTILLHERHELLHASTVALLQPRGFGAQVRDEDVRVPQRAELTGEPPQLRAQRLAPLGREHGPRRPQHRA
jgi:hypothetical protein